jgi:type IV secretory pathway VirB2 component (pilin)
MRTIVARTRRLLTALIVQAVPTLALAQASPFMTGATSLQSNILAWLTPVAVILVMILGAMAMANRLSWGWCIGAILGIAQVSSTYGHADAHTIVENCGNTLILRCSASEGGGTARFASQLIGEREVIRTTVSRTRRPAEFCGSKTHSEHYNVEPALLPSQIEQLPDMSGYFKCASRPEWLAVNLSVPTPASPIKPRGQQDLHIHARPPSNRARLTDGIEYE